MSFKESTETGETLLEICKLVRRTPVSVPLVDPLLNRKPERVLINNRPLLWYDVSNKMEWRLSR